MTALEYMTKQLNKHCLNYEREKKRGVPEEMLRNIEAKIGYYAEAVEALKVVAANVVEVVRCKDCVYYEIHKPRVFRNCERNNRLMPMNPNDYCSHGKRKDGAGE